MENALINNISGGLNKPHRIYKILGNLIKVVSAFRESFKALGTIK